MLNHASASTINTDDFVNMLAASETTCTSQILLLSLRVIYCSALIKVESSVFHTYVLASLLRLFLLNDKVETVRLFVL